LETEFTNESELIRALKKGDEKAVEALFRSTYQRLCNYANTLLKDMDESEEVTQQVFVMLWEKRETMEINSSLQSYLFRTVRNNCLNRVKHTKVRQLYANEISALSGSAEPASTMSFHNELQSRIQAEIENLPEQCRLVFKLSRFEELKYAEIADQLGISIKTVENHMGKALRIMRERLKEYLILIVMFLSHYIN
jgi:RNA polymerase sigma-70 factor, ECF subfamily